MPKKRFTDEQVVFALRQVFASLHARLKADLHQMTTMLRRGPSE